MRRKRGGFPHWGDGVWASPTARLNSVTASLCASVGSRPPLPPSPASPSWGSPSAAAVCASCAPRAATSRSMHRAQRANSPASASATWGHGVFANTKVSACISMMCKLANHAHSGVHVGASIGTIKVLKQRANEQSSQTCPCRQTGAGNARRSCTRWSQAPQDRKHAAENR